MKFLKSSEWIGFIKFMSFDILREKKYYPKEGKLAY
jgi:hypothetical protein